MRWKLRAPVRLAMTATLAIAASVAITSGPFPLAVSQDGTHLVNAQGNPFLVAGDTPWSLPVNCTLAQIDSYLADRSSKGCTAILIEGCEKAFSSQTPAYLNVDGEAPFTNMSPVNWIMNNGYWNYVDYIVDSCLALGMAVFITPAYTGVGGSDGWMNDYSGVSDATLQAYGAALANRFTQGNVVWVLGGDDANDLQAFGDYDSATTPDRTKQWQIVLGMRTVRTTDLITGHTARNGNGGVSGEAYKGWTDGYTGFNLNNVYPRENQDDGYLLGADAASRAGFPSFMIEAGYEDIDGNANNGVYPAIQAMLSGSRVGWFDGHDALWHMGSLAPNNGGAASVLSTYLAGSWLMSQYLATLMNSYAWHTLEPQTGSALVTTSLGSGAGRIYPALAADASFAMIWTNGANFTVALSALAPDTVRARWWNPQTGEFTAIANYSSTGTQAFVAPGSRILVLDAAP